MYKTIMDLDRYFKYLRVLNTECIEPTYIHKVCKYECGITFATPLDA